MGQTCPQAEAEEDPSFAVALHVTAAFSARKDPDQGPCYSAHLTPFSPTANAAAGMFMKETLQRFW